MCQAWQCLWKTRRARGMSPRSWGCGRSRSVYAVARLIREAHTPPLPNGICAACLLHCHTRSQSTFCGSGAPLLHTEASARADTRSRVCRCNWKAGWRGRGSLRACLRSTHGPDEAILTPLADHVERFPLHCTCSSHTNLRTSICGIAAACAGCLRSYGDVRQEGVTTDADGITKVLQCCACEKSKGIDGIPAINDYASCHPYATIGLYVRRGLEGTRPTVRICDCPLRCVFTGFLA